MRKVIIVSFSVLFCFHLLSFQKTDVGNNKINKAKDFILNEKNTDSIKSFLAKVLTTNSDLAKEYYQFYLSRGIKENNYQIQFIAYYYLGDISYDLGDYVETINYGKSALKIAEKQKHTRNQIVALNQLGNVFYNIRDYDTSLNHYLAAYKIVKNDSFKSLELHILGNISMIRTRIHRYDDALLSYQKIIDLLQDDAYKDVPNYHGIYLSSIQGAGVCNFLLKEYDKALKYYAKGFRLAEKYKSDKHITMFHMTSGEVFTAQQEYALALHHLFEAKKGINSSKITFNPLLHTTNFHIASVYFKKEEYSKTLDYLSESFNEINTTAKLHEVEKISEMYDLALRSAEKLGNTEKQIYYSKLYRNIIDSLHQDDISTKDMLYDKDIEELEKENQNLSSQKLLFSAIVIISIILIIGLSIYSIRKNHKNKITFKKLQNQIEKSIATPLPSLKKDFITNEKAMRIFDKLHDLEETDFFLDQNCNLYSTAKQIETNTTYLSKIINEYRFKTFNGYINELRIRHCLTRLKKDKKFRSYTIKAISGELGYKSVNTFASAFKKQTGISHSYYIKQTLKKENGIQAIHME